MSALLATVARGATERGPSTIDEVFERCDRAPAQAAFVRAAAVASTTDRLAWVFAAAYSGALRSLFGSQLPTDGVRSLRTALCVTEDGGNTPRAIETVYSEGVVRGEKSFVTFGNSAESLIVLASRGTDEHGQKDLVLVRVMATEASLAESLEAPFVPEIPHSRVVFEDAPATLLSEKAWPKIKGFRFVEDLFVLGCTIAWFCGLCAAAGDADRFGRFAAHLAACEALSTADPASSASHLAYAAILDAAESEFEAFDWRMVSDPEVESRWQRDRPLLRIAARARAVRRDYARQSMG